MTYLRLTLAALVVSALVAGLAAHGQAQSVDEAEQEAADAKRRAEVASGLVDEAVAERESVEIQLAESMARANELSAQLSIVGARLDRVASQVGFADAELESIQRDIETQAVDAYMTALSSPSAYLLGSSSVETAMVAGAVVEDVVAADRARVGELFIKRRSLEQLRELFLLDQEEFQALRTQVEAEIENLARLYEKADAAVAAAVRESQTADAAYQVALTALDQARVRDEERKRQEARATTTTTTSPASSPNPEQNPTPWVPPPAAERWRGLVETFFPANRVQEALRIMDCESNGDPDAYNPYSGASGLYQFLPSTWAATAPRAGYPDASPFDPEANTATAAWLANRYEELGLYYWQAWSCRRVLDSS